MAKYLGLDTLKNIMDILKYNGGVRNTFLKLMRTDTLKMGTLVGVDRLGNKYYENNKLFYGRNRWVIYSDKFGYDYDASQVDPEWYGWLHYKTDYLPHEDPTRPKYKWMASAGENPSGTSDQYVPYSTTLKKVEAWIPPKPKK